MRSQRIKKLTPLLLSAFLITAIFTGCSDQSIKLKVLQDQVATLTNENQILEIANQRLQDELDKLKTIDYEETYKLSGGSYKCANAPGREITEFRFLSDKLIHITGRDFEKSVAFDNYYIVSHNVSLMNFSILSEVFVNDERGYYTLEALQSGGTVVNFKLSADLKILTYSPYVLGNECTYIPDLEPKNASN